MFTSNGTGPTEAQIYNNKVDKTKLPKYTRAQLSKYNGIDDPQIYVAIRGIIYDVTANEANYGPGKAYHKLVAKDVSRLLGLNRLVLPVSAAPAPEEAYGEDLTLTTWYTEDLDDKQNGIIDNWITFFEKRYHIVGVVEV
ncbi:putative steroid-binding protein 3 [Spathaspora sp. JA1]|nr:putative steroid-binding protein 3 [Spathaspora sp. JA1]